MMSERLIYPIVLFLSLILPTGYPQTNPKQKIGDITIEGATVLTTKKLLAITGIKSKQDFTPDTIELTAGRIKRAYMERGLIKIDVSIMKELTAKPTCPKNEGVNLKITINEGPAYYISRTEVIGNETTGHRVVMQAAGLSPGEPYNPNRIEVWAAGLNRLGRFERVKREDIEVELDHKEHLADVRFHLKENPGLKIRTH